MPNIYSLDLHNLNLKGENVREVIHKKIDTFITPHLTKHGRQIDIIVGRGNNSSTYNYINNMPVLRYYTLEYLDMIGVKSKYNSMYGKVTFVI
jgi:hexokinase